MEKSLLFYSPLLLLPLSDSSSPLLLTPDDSSSSLESLPTAGTSGNVSGGRGQGRQQRPSPSLTWIRRWVQAGGQCRSGPAQIRRLHPPLHRSGSRRPPPRGSGGGRWIRVWDDSGGDNNIWQQRARVWEWIREIGFQLLNFWDFIVFRLLFLHVDDISTRTQKSDFHVQVRHVHKNNDFCSPLGACGLPSLLQKSNLTVWKKILFVSDGQKKINIFPLFINIFMFKTRFESFKTWRLVYKIY